MRILFTGMASSHCKETENTTFFGTLVSLYKTVADVVDIATPSVDWSSEYLNSYDAVFVGILPPTSPSANKLYGALHVMALLQDSNKLNLVIEHPQIWQYKSSIASVIKNTDSLFGSFYRTKHEYKKALASKDTIQSGLNTLSSSQWPTTVYPLLPWNSSEKILEFFPWVDAKSFVGINLDAFLVSEDFPEITSRDVSWSIDIPNTAWAKKLAKLTTYQILGAKESIRASDTDVYSKISKSSGFILSSQDRGVGTWWSYRLIQALNSMTPIVTEWKESQVISPSWGVLIGELEDMDYTDRIKLALSQKTSYRNSLPDKNEVLSLLENLVKKNEEGI